MARVASSQLPYAGSKYHTIYRRRSSETSLAGGKREIMFIQMEWGGRQLNVHKDEENQGSS